MEFHGQTFQLAGKLALLSVTGTFGRCAGGTGSAFACSATTLESFIDRRPQINQHAKRLSRRVFGMEHHFPRLADHAKAGSGFGGGELSAPAVESVDAALFQFAQSVEDGIQIIMHETEENPAHHET